MTTHLPLIYHDVEANAHVHSDTEEGLGIGMSLASRLPHGSGIDYTWEIDVHINGTLKASNHYHAMDMNGMYCHTYPFTAVFGYNGPNMHRTCTFCEGRGIRYVHDLMQYHPNMGMNQLCNWLVNRLDTTIVHNLLEDNDNPYFTCNVCHGSGKVCVPEFPVHRVNMHGAHERACCGTSLRDHLTLMLDGL